MKTRELALTVSTGVLFALASLNCKEQNNPLTGDSPSNVVFPARDVSYDRHVQVLFNQTCALSGCHDVDAPVGRVKLTTWGHTVLDLPGIVIAGEPDNSELVFRIDGRVGVGRMPPYGNPLNQNQINGIRTWIAEGAKQN
jgi:mono/diheme cytochrome c family protein